MPFQSEKQRRYLHANHPEIAQRWEKEYANGGISNHFRKKSSSAEGPGGIANHFKLKDGGNIRLGPHKATDLLVKKTSTGERPKYQPPGGGETSLGSGAAHSGGASDRGPRDDPDRFGPTTTTTTTSTGGDGPRPHVDTGDEEEAYEIVDGQKVPLSLRGVKGIDPREDPGREDKLRTYTQRMNDIQNEIKEKWRRKIDPTVWEQIKDMPTLSFVGILTAIATDIYDKREMKKDMELLKELGLDKGHPSGTDTAYSQLQDYFAKIKLRKKDDDTRGDGVAPVPPLPVVMDEMADATGQIDMFDAWGDIKQKQALRAALFADEDQAKVGDWVGDQRLLVNSGGLANLFRVKNQ